MTARLLTTLAAAALSVGALTTAPAQADDVSRAIGNIAKSYLSAEQDKAAFAQAQKANTASAYRQYLAQFPNGAYASYARDRLISLGGAGYDRGAGSQAGDSSAEMAEVNLRLSRSQRAQIQRELTALGYSTNGSDGLFGSGTRRAIQRWQGAQGWEATGYLTAGQVQRLHAQAGGRVQAGSDRGAQDGADHPRMQETLIGLNAAERVEMQTRLTMLGYNTRGTDGGFGANTRSAIARWQGDNGYAQTGYLTADQVQRLRSQSRR